MLGPGDVRSLLTEHGLAPHRALGQNFVVDPNTVRKVVRDAGVGAGDLVVEIGPGLGSLTLALREAGARVIAVEVDAGLVRALSTVVGDDADVQIVHADALRVSYGTLVGGVPALLVANLPYNVATPLLITALRSGVFASAHVMVQREVGQRWTARPGDALYSGVSVKVAALGRARVVARISRKAFYPVPNVDSVTVAVTPHVDPVTDDLDRLFTVVEAGFGQRRKRLRNTLTGPGVTADEVEGALRRCGLDAGARPEELALDAWVELSAAL